MDGMGDNSGMKKYRPFLILFVILVLPILVYVFVKNFGTQLYHPLKTLSPKIQNPDGSPDSVYKTVGNFAFPSQTGDTITLDSLRGKIWVADVFFSTCPGICPKLSAAMRKVQDRFKSDNDIRFVSITVDPENDSIPVLREYADRYDAIDHKWYFLTGPRDEIYRFAHQEFFFSATEDENAEIKFIHDKTLRLVDKEGKFRGMFYDGTNPVEVDSVISHIDLLKLEYNQRK
jgi:protein SCO1